MPGLVYSDLLAMLVNPVIGPKGDQTKPIGVGRDARTGLLRPSGHPYRFFVRTTGDIIKKEVLCAKNLNFC
jgi:hypothetical protein